ncbi:MAG: TolC family protein [Acidobacteria bacterium]|nr:TolC family protein [Acidobacteriota bacterium]
MARALEKNLDIQREKLNPAAQDYSMVAARAAFRPTFTARTSYNNSARTSTSSLDGASRLVAQTQTYNVGASQRMPWYGGTLTIGFNNNRAADNSANTLRNPNYRATTSFNYTQPLWQNLKIDSQRSQLRTLEVQREITDIAVLQQIENIKNQVRTAYWALRQSIEAIEIQRRSLDLSRRNYDDNKVKVEVGTVAEIDLVQLESQIATGEQQLLAAEIAWRNAELAFKRLVVDSTEDDFFRATINPTEVPSIQVQDVDIPAAVSRALADRTDIVTARKNLKVAELGLTLNENSTKPALDLQTAYSLEGTGGNFKDSTGTLIESGYYDALKAIGTRETPTWSLQLNVNYPLGMAAAKANLARARLQYQQSEIAIKNQGLTIETVVTRAGLDVQSTYKQLLAAQKSREAAERTLEAELTRFSVGMSTNFQVISLQNALTSARNNELSATIRYINAIAEFDRVQRIQ